MRKILMLFACLTLFMACSDDGFSNNNPYLPNYNFSVDIDFSLPLYNDLNFVGNAVPITIEGIGINGIVVMKTGSGFVAYELSCPNQELTNCSVLTIDGINVVCPCDGVEYSLYTGLPAANTEADLKYSLKPYRIQIISDTYIRVSN
ncbi:Rieske (2Fe-2S) protein [Flavobacterium rhizosphaerae]|uniref:Rieske domain-containing protein n=1 Tax=Flavobacterium rhizosphaerae TaxID=3163298 RepID=A0ABW8YYE3_9FLAO